MQLARAATREYRTWTTDSRRWSRYLPRESDIVIATYPKSGTTWVQRIVGALVFQTAEPMPFSGEIPLWIDGRTMKSLDDLVVAIEAQTHRRFLKAHLPFDGLPIFEQVKYIHVARDGRDVVMSWHDHDNAWLEQAVARLDVIGLGDELIGRRYPDRTADPAATFHRWLGEGATTDQPDGLPNLSWFEFEASWWSARQLPNVLMVHYHDLKSDLGQEIARIAAFLAIPLSEVLLSQLVEAARFDGMQREGDALLPHQVGIFRGGHRSFLNKGTGGRWRGVFQGEDLAVYQAKLARAVPPECVEWLERGGPIA